MNFDSQDFFGDLLEALRASGLEFIVCGGVAAILHGVERTTLDVDLSVSLAPDNIPLLISAMENTGLRPRLPINPALLADERVVSDMVNQKHAVVFTFFHPTNRYVQVDVFLKPELQYSVLKPFSELIPFRGSTLQVLSARKLLQLKEDIDPPREKDEMDIKILNKLYPKQK